MSDGNPKTVPVATPEEWDELDAIEIFQATRGDVDVPTENEHWTIRGNETP